MKSLLVSLRFQMSPIRYVIHGLHHIYCGDKVNILDLYSNQIFYLILRTYKKVMLRKNSILNQLREIIVGNYLNLLSIRQAIEILLGMTEIKSAEKS